MERLVLYTELLKPSQLFFLILVIHGDEIGSRVVAVFKPSEQQPVHNVRMPVPLRYLGFPQYDNVLDGLHGELSQPCRLILMR